MQKNRLKLLIIALLATVLYACDTSKNTNNNASSETESSEIIDDSYQPGEAWKLVWSDEFNGKKVNTSNWNHQIVKAGRFNEEWQRYTDSEENAYIEDGSLVIEAIHESDEHGLNQYTSARMNTANKQYWKYGKIAARMKLPYGQGIWPAFWMLGNNINENGGDTPWPQCGEIDILELYGTRDDAVVEANLHYANKEDSHSMMGAVPYKLEAGIFADSFHVFALEWDSEKVTWLVDENQYAATPINTEEFKEFHEEFFILFNIAVGGTYAGYPDSTTVFPQKMYVDWVRVYEQKE